MRRASPHHQVVEGRTPHLRQGKPAARDDLSEGRLNGGGGPDLPEPPAVPGSADNPGVPDEANAGSHPGINRESELQRWVGGGDKAGNCGNPPEARYEEPASESSISATTMATSSRVGAPWANSSAARLTSWTRSWALAWPWASTCDCVNWAGDYTLIHPTEREPAIFFATLGMAYVGERLQPRRIFLDLALADDEPGVPSQSCGCGSESVAGYVQDSWVLSWAYWCELAALAEQATSMSKPNPSIPSAFCTSMAMAGYARWV